MPVFILFHVKYLLALIWFVLNFPLFQTDWFPVEFNETKETGGNGI